MIMSLHFSFQEDVNAQNVNKSNMWKDTRKCTFLHVLTTNVFKNQHAHSRISVRVFACFYFIDTLGLCNKEKTLVRLCECAAWSESTLVRSWWNVHFPASHFKERKKCIQLPWESKICSQICSWRRLFISFTNMNIKHVAFVLFTL